MNSIEAISGVRPLGKRSRAWGCRVWMCKKGKRSHELDDHSIKGRFLGYVGATKNIAYLDENNNTIKTAKSAIFDELFSDLNAPPPNAQMLRNILWNSKFEPEKEPILPPDEMRASASHFNIFHDLRIKVTCN